MGFEELLGFFAALAFVFVVGCLVAYSSLPRPLKLLIYAALSFRAVGAIARHTVLFQLYRGSGDARGYYNVGVRYAELFWELDFSPFYDTSHWVRNSWDGTQFVTWPSGIVMSLIGPSLLGGFLAFSLMAFAGLVGFAIAFQRSYPHLQPTSYLKWIWLFPSLWYWPSSIGKEAIIFLGLGLAVVGFIGRNDRINWPLLIVGCFFVFAIRPQVAAVVILSIIVAQTLGSAQRWTLRKAIQQLLILGVGIGGISLSMSYIGVEGLDPEGVQTYMEGNKGRRLGGGSAVEAAEVSPAGVPVALMNILMRPFPWEAGNAQMLFSAVEILAFWGIVWYRRRNLMNALRNWRSDRFLRMAIPFILVYAITLGMVVSNLGLIARQRVFLFPFLFLLLEAMPARRERGPRRIPLQTLSPAAGRRPNLAKAGAT